ncbi:MAG: Ig-like domain-containing protein, partial [Sphingobacteriaceae bacterium]|nr:Ig-like domain-containing protein [Cytophagaceae bacterium]
MTKIAFLPYAVGLIILALGCAQQSSPTGGPKDVTPPTLIRSVPVNQTTRYEGKRVELEFDEYVSVDNINQQLLITPALDGNYTVKIRPRGASLNLEKPLRPNTTYSFNFRETFKDITERNPARNMKLVFSTGTTIDSLSVRGTVTDVLTSKPLLEVTVGLYLVSDTLQFSKVRPYYFARTDSAGNYALENLKPDTYQLAAFTDGNNNVLYDAAKERIGFEADPFKLTGNLSNRNVQVAFADRTPNRVVTTRPAINYYTVVYAKGVKQVKVRFQTPADSLPYLFLDEKQLRFFNVKNATDTIRASIEATDSLDLVFRHEQKIKFRPKGRREEGTREAFELKTSPADRAETPNPFVYKLRFNKPILRYDLGLL